MKLVYCKDPWTLSGFRVEVHEPDGLVSHFGEYVLDRNHVLDFHSHATWELVLQTKGTSVWVEGSRQCRLREGDLLVCPPGLSHGKTHRGSLPFRIYFAGLRMDPAQWPLLRRHLSENHFVRIAQAIEITADFRHLEDELLLERLRQGDGVKLAWSRLWLAVYRLAATPQRTWGQHDQRLSLQVKGMIESQPGEHWTLVTTARLVGYSPNHFAGLFRRQTGQTFHQFLMETRIEGAKKFLELDQRSLTDIALDLGFSSSQHFSSAFSKKTGISPLRWRQRLQARKNIKPAPRAAQSRPIHSSPE